MSGATEQTRKVNAPDAVPCPNSRELSPEATAQHATLIEIYDLLRLIEGHASATHNLFLEFFEALKRQR
jgi:hypothetical protein